MSTLKATLTGEFESLYWFDVHSLATGRFIAACCLAPSDGPLPLEAAGGCYDDWLAMGASSADLRSLFDLDDDDDVREHLAESAISACCESF
jgi:hypothetical protein